MNLQMTLETWLSNNQAVNQTQQFVDLTERLGYRDLHDFFDDNSGCIDACYNWVGKQRSKEWQELLSPVLRDDIRQLLERGFIELDCDSVNDQTYIGVSTRNVILIEDPLGARYLVGSIVVSGEKITFYDEADNEIKNIGDNWVYGYELGC